MTVVWDMRVCKSMIYYIIHQGACPIITNPPVMLGPQLVQGQPRHHLLRLHAHQLCTRLQQHHALAKRLDLGLLLGKQLLQARSLGISICARRFPFAFLGTLRLGVKGVHIAGGVSGCLRAATHLCTELAH